MTLAGLLAAVASEEAVAEAVRRARATGTAGATAALDIAAPDALQPLLIAALAAPSAGDRPVLAVTATGREAEDLAAALRSPAARRRRSPTSPAWETLPHERLQPAQRHRRPPAGRAAPARATRAPTTRPPARCGSSSRRSARCCSRRCAGSATSSRCELRAGRRRRRSTTSYAGSPTRRTPGSTWSRSAASSRSAAASSTSSRRPRSTRCAWSSGATTVEEIRCVRGRRPAHASRARRTGCGRRRAASCCSPTTCARAPPRSAQQHPELAEMLDKLAEGIAVEGMESLAPGAGRRDGAARSTCCRPAPTCWCATRSGSAPGRTTWSPPARSSSRRRWAAAAGGGNAPPIDLGAAAYRDARRRARAARARAGTCRGGSVSPFAAPTRSVAAERSTTSTASSCDAPRRRARYRGDTARALGDTQAAGSATAGAVVLVTEGHGPAQRLVEVLGERRRRRPGSTRPRRSPPEPGVVHVTSGCARARLRRRRRCGWRCSPRPTWSGSGPSTKDMRRMPSRRRNTIDPLELQGRRLRRARAARRRPLRRDGAAHGRRARPASTSSSSTPRPSAASPADRLYVPTDQLDQVTRYVGGEAARAAPARRRRLAKTQGPRPQGGHARSPPS